MNAACSYPRPAAQVRCNSGMGLQEAQNAFDGDSVGSPGRRSVAPPAIRWSMAIGGVSAAFTNPTRWHTSSGNRRHDTGSEQALG